MATQLEAVWWVLETLLEDGRVPFAEVLGKAFGSLFVALIPVLLLTKGTVRTGPTFRFFRFPVSAPSLALLALAHHLRGVKYLAQPKGAFGLRPSLGRTKLSLSLLTGRGVLKSTNEE
jgi:hypothetical protein